MRRTLALVIVVLMMAWSVSAQGLPPAPISNDEGGVQFIRGDAPYTFPYFRLFLPQPYIVLYDAAGIIDQNMAFIPREESQVLGAITSDPFTSPFRYEMSLPYHAGGELRDLDNNGQTDGGVGVYVLTVTSNTWNDPFLELRDDYVTGIIRSAEVSNDVDQFLQVTRGWLAVYAPDAQQGFPSGRGLDGVLFSPDDPAVSIPQGWTVVDISGEPFTFTRTREVNLSLLEAEDAALDDFSSLSYVDSFEAMIDLLKQKYAFTVYKNIDWEALRSEFRPRIERAQQNRSSLEFQRTLRDLSWRIPDGHVSGPSVSDDFQQAALGGLGMVLRELDDGRVIVAQIIPNGVAAGAGIQTRAEIVSIDGQPIGEALKAVVPYTGPFSTPHNLRLEQLRFVARRPIGTDIQLGARAADGSIQTFDLTAQFDIDGFFAANFNLPLVGTELPIEYELLDSGVAKVSIYSFSDDLPLTVALWERAIQRAKFDEAVGIIIDIRQNGGGSGFLGDQLPAYFFDQDYVIGNRAEYSKLRGDFVVNPLLEERFILPPAELRYDGAVAVLISPDCASACESFAYAMTINNRAAIIGHTPTAGLGGSVVPIAMPDGASFNYTNSRSLGADGQINIEGKGVAPTVRVPLTEETVFADYDVLLDAALRYLREEADPNQNPPVTAGQVLPISVGQTVSGQVAPTQPVHYRLTLTAGGIFDIIASGTGATERGLVVRVLTEDGSRLLSESYTLPGGVAGAGFKGLALPANLTVLIEVASAAPTVSGAFTLMITEVR